MSPPPRYLQNKGSGTSSLSHQDSNWTLGTVSWRVIIFNSSMVSFILPYLIDYLILSVIQPHPNSSPSWVLLKPRYLSSKSSNIPRLTFFFHQIRHSKLIPASAFLTSQVAPEGTPLPPSHHITLSEYLHHQPWQNHICYHKEVSLFGFLCYYRM